MGKAGLDLPVIGEGYDIMPPDDVQQAKAYGEARPVYADPLVGGLGYGPGDIQTALRAAGERVFVAQDAAGQAGVMVVSADMAPRRSLLSRLAGRLRRR